jgi:hypothetical protein
VRSILVWALVAAGLAVSAASFADSLDSLHCADPPGAPLLKGHAATLTGIVTAQFSTARSTRLFLQGTNVAVNVFGAPANCALIGDSLRVSGEVGAYNGLTEIVGSDDHPLAIEALGHGAIPAPMPVDLRHVPDLESGGCDPTESKLVSLTNVIIRAARGGALADTSRFREDTTYLIAPALPDTSIAGVPMRVMAATGCPGTATIAGAPIPRGPLQIIGILSRYQGRGATHGVFQMLPRSLADLRAVKPAATK